MHTVLCKRLHLVPLMLIVAVVLGACNDDSSECEFDTLCESETGPAVDAGLGTRDAATSRDAGAGDAARIVDANMTRTPSASVVAVIHRVRRSGEYWNVPALLFEDGWAALSVRGATVKTPAADRQSNPKDWAQWRRNGEAIEARSSDGTWDELSSGEEEYLPMPKGSTLDLPYKTISVTSSGDSTFIRSAILDFRSDSTFSWSKSASSSYERLPFSAQSASDRGTYTIDGFLLTLRYADGRSEEHCLVNGGGDEWMIWINNALYCRLQQDGDSSCSSDSP